MVLLVLSTQKVCRREKEKKGGVEKGKEAWSRWKEGRERESEGV